MEVGGAVRARGEGPAIRPSQYWRGREAHLALTVVFGPAVAGGLMGPFGVTTGLVVLFLSLGAGALSWIYAPTWRLRVTRDGDFLLYARSPNRTKWAGRAEQLEFESVRTANGDPLGWIYFTGPNGKEGHHVYPMSAQDGGRLDQMHGWSRRARRR